MNHSFHKSHETNQMNLMIVTSTTSRVIHHSKVNLVVTMKIMVMVQTQTKMGTITTTIYLIQSLIAIINQRQLLMTRILACNSNITQITIKMNISNIRNNSNSRRILIQLRITWIIIVVKTLPGWRNKATK